MGKPMPLTIQKLSKHPETKCFSRSKISKRNQTKTSKFFTANRYSATHGHSLKLFEKRSRLLVRANSFSKRVVDSWNSLTEDIVNAPSLNAFKSRLNLFWRGHQYKFSPTCYSPGQCTRDRIQNQNASEEANGPYKMST